MPLPRFQRLPADAQTAFLDVARAHFARDGRDAASLARIVEDAGVSKSSAYHYFDGKDDLFVTVAADTLVRISTVLGPWPGADSEAELWERFHDASARLSGFLLAHPVHRALLERIDAQAEPSPWLRAFFANAVALGLVDTAPNAQLLEDATLALLQATDRWALPRLSSPGAAEAVSVAAEALLRRLWRGG
ncbi:TetR/AcrR family transcriptional regulator [Lysobacter enzymogenes]|uniref:TetR/AcrR family transcriptional regulator n=1 Tax=Lysobacter enzymogenes TaxID=69 RepID=UPI00384F563C